MALVLRNFFVAQVVELAEQASTYKATFGQQTVCVACEVFKCILLAFNLLFFRLGVNVIEADDNEAVQLFSIL